MIQELTSITSTIEALEIDTAQKENLLRWMRALGPTRILTIDHKNFLRRIHEDPSLAYRLMEVMSNRVRRLSGKVAELKHYPEQHYPQI